MGSVREQDMYYPICIGGATTCNWCPRSEKGSINEQDVNINTRFNYRKFSVIWDTF